MNDDELQRLQQQVADEVSRRQAEDHNIRPSWHVALDELCMANYENPDFWVQLRATIGAGDTDEDLNMARQFYAKRCRICSRPMHKTWFRCNHCNADNYGPDVIKGATVAVELETA